MRKFLVMLLVFSFPLIANAFSNADILEAIKNSTSYGETENIIAENSSDIGIDKSGYDDLDPDQKEEIMQEITGGEFGSIDDLKNKFNELVNQKTECIMEVSLEKKDSYYEGTVTVHNLSDSAVFGVAKYKNGKLLSFEVKDLTGDTEAFTVYNDIDIVKIILWSSILEMKPLCKAQNYNIKSMSVLN